MKRLHLIPLIVLSACALLNTGCSTYQTQSRKMTEAWVNGDPAVAAERFGQRASRNGKSKDAIIWHLEAGAAYRAIGEFEKSNEHLDAAAVRIEDYEEQARLKVGREAGAIMSNQQNLPYEGRAHDKIMLHTYKALNYLALGELEMARPELLRAYQRQQDAVEENARRIEEAMQEVEESNEREDVEATKAHPDLVAALDEITHELEGFRYYADYVNPFTVYLDGLYFLHGAADGSDLERASKSFHRVMEVAGENPFVEADLVNTLSAMNGMTPEPCTYVVFETGRAPSLDQIRIDVPILISSLSYVGTAFPRLEFHHDYSPQLRISTGEVETFTIPLASMDAIVALDFKNEWPAILTKTIVSTVAKAAATYAVNEAASGQDAMIGLFARLATAIAQAAVNIADTRCWTTLPKEFQVARIPTPANGKLALSAGLQPPLEVELEAAEVNVVYARSITPTSPLLVSQFKLR